MANQRRIGIDFGTSTTVIRVKRYDEQGKPIGDPLGAESVTFNVGQTVVPTLIQRIESEKNASYYGYDALVPRKKAVLYQNFKVDLESENIEKCLQAKEDTKEFFKYLGETYRHQRDSGYFGGLDDQEQTIITYPAKWDEGTRYFMLDCAKEAGFRNVQGMDEAQAAIQTVLIQGADLLSTSDYLKQDVPIHILLLDMGAGTTDLVLCRYTPGQIPKNEILCIWPKKEGNLFSGKEVDKILRDYISFFLPEENANAILKKFSIDKFRTWKETIVSPTLAKGDTVTEFNELEMILDYSGLEMDKFYLTPSIFEEVSEEYLNQLPQLINECIAKADISSNDIDLIITTGGHSQWYFVNKILTDSLTDINPINLTKIKNDSNRIISMPRPQEAVALGSVYLSLQKEEDADTLFKLGVDACDKEDYKTATNYFKKAAEQGFAKAQYNLGVCYDNGIGVEQDDKQAVEWYRKAAEQGYTSAQNDLGICYEKGEGVEEDYKEAVYWYRKAAEQGDAAAQFNLGICYDYGKGVEKDYKEAVYWYQKAAEQGLKEAQYNLGVSYEFGKGVRQDYKEAVYWYRKAAAQGDAQAQSRLKQIKFIKLKMLNLFKPF